MSFLPNEEEGEYALAILHVDPMQRIQLLAREIVTNDESEDWELSPFPSTILQPTAISNKTFPFPNEYPPRLIPVQPADIQQDSDEDEDQKEDDGLDFLGGVLVVGGRKLLLYELATPQGRAKQKGKMKRLQDKLKTNTDPSKLREAKAKQLERDARKRKPTASVDWPWGEVTAYVFSLSLLCQSNLTMTNARWCDVEGAPFRFFLADAFGALSLISLDNVKSSGLLLIPLGVVSLPDDINLGENADNVYSQTSPATSLTYLTNQALYIGSHLGDSQLITITQIPSKTEDQAVLSIPFGIRTYDRTAITSGSKKGKQRADEDMDVDGSEEDGDGLANGRIIAPDGSYVRVVQSFKNIGPIIDAVMVDVEGSGQVSPRQFE
jgi:DNA damage-binding protein 1